MVSDVNDKAPVSNDVGAFLLVDAAGIEPATSVPTLSGAALYDVADDLISRSRYFLLFSLFKAFSLINVSFFEENNSE
jgi:hypothetical protein